MKIKLKLNKQTNNTKENTHNKPKKKKQIKNKKN